MKAPVREICDSQTCSNVLMYLFQSHREGTPGGLSVSIRCLLTLQERWGEFDCPRDYVPGFIQDTWPHVTCAVAISCLKLQIRFLEFSCLNYSSPVSNGA